MSAHAVTTPLTPSQLRTHLLQRVHWLFASPSTPTQAQGRRHSTPPLAAHSKRHNPLTVSPASSTHPWRHKDTRPHSRQHSISTARSVCVVSCSTGAGSENSSSTDTRSQNRNGSSTTDAAKTVIRAVSKGGISSARSERKGTRSSADSTAQHTRPLGDPKQLTALIRCSDSLDDLAALLEQHCGIGVGLRVSKAKESESQVSSAPGQGSQAGEAPQPPQVLDGMAISAALHRLATLMSRQFSSSESTLSTSTQTMDLAAVQQHSKALTWAVLEACMAHGLLETMRWRELSSLLWSTARLGMRVTYSEHTNTLQPQPKQQLPVNWVTAVLQRMADLGFSSSDAQALSNTGWALSKLEVLPEAGWMDSYLQAVHASLPRLHAQHLANILYALAKMHTLHTQKGLCEGFPLPPSRAWMDAFLDEVSAAMGPPPHYHSTWAPPPRSVHKKQQQQQQRSGMHNPARTQAGPAFLLSTPQQYANVLYALAVLGSAAPLNPPPSDQATHSSTSASSNAPSSHTQARLPAQWLHHFWSCSSAQLWSAPHANSSAQLQSTPPADDDTPMSDTPTTPLASDVASQGSESLAADSESLQSWLQLRQRAIEVPSTFLRPQHSANLVWAAAKLVSSGAAVKPPVYWTDTVERLLLIQAPCLSPTELCSVVYAYGLMWTHPRHPDLLPLLLSWAMQHARWGQMTLQGVVNILWGLARLSLAAKSEARSNSRPATSQQARKLIDAVWLQTVLGCVLSGSGSGSSDDGSESIGSMREKQLSVQAVANILWGAAVLGLDPGREWVLVLLRGVMHGGADRAWAERLYVAVAEEEKGVREERRGAAVNKKEEGVAVRQVQWALRRLGYYK